MKTIALAVSFAASLLAPNVAHALTGSAEIFEVKQFAQGGADGDKNGYLQVRIDGFSGTDRQCTNQGVTTLRITSDRSMYAQLMQLATTAMLSGRRVGVWFTVTDGTCNLFAIALR